MSKQFNPFSPVSCRYGAPMERPGDTDMFDCYVICGPKGLAYVGLHEDEADCWRIFLGWPTVGEVKETKARGYYCAKATITWIKEG